jgi:hypothetical protein
LTIEATDVGETVLVEATRHQFFVFGHHMGKADLRYLAQDGNILTHLFSG